MSVENLLIKEDSVFAAVREVTEGVLAEPANAGDGYIQLKRDGVELEDDREVKERAVFTGTLSDANPRLGIRTGKGTFPAEARGQGLEGAEPDFGILIESLLPDKNWLADRVVSGVGHSASRIYLNVDNSDQDRFKRGDTTVILVPGAYWPVAITLVDKTPGGNFIEVLPALPVDVFPDQVEIAKFTAYRGADAGHPSFSALAYWGSQSPTQGIRQAILGSRTNNMALDKFTTGELPELKFGFEGLSFTETPDKGATYTPTFDDGLPGVVLNSVIYKDAVAVDVDGIQWGVEQPLAFLKSTSSANGRVAGRASGTRKVTGTIAPYTDGTSVDAWDKWEAGTNFSVFGYLALPDEANGIKLGSVIMFFLPNCFTKKPSHKDMDGVLTDNIEFSATGGNTGQDMDFSIGFC